MSKNMNLKNRIALITGAGSGIGQATAVALSKRGCNLVLTDINKESLKSTVSLCKSAGGTVACHQLDVADAKGVMALSDVVNRDLGKIDVLINNAGVALLGKLEQISDEDFRWLFEINFFGVVNMCRAFLPLLKKSDGAWIVNVSSLFGIIAPPNNIAYTASKFAVRGFSQALAHELSGLNIGVTTVHPGGISTSIANNARAYRGAPEAEIKEGLEKANKLLTLPASVAGEVIVKAIEQRKKRLLIGNDAKIAASLERLFPVSYWNLIERYIPG